MERNSFKTIGAERQSPSASNGLSSTVVCPSCNHTRRPEDSIIPDWQCPKCGIAYAKRKAALNKAVRVRLVSGQEIAFQEIKLYDADMIYHLDRLRQAAAQNLAGYSTGLGFWGSLEWAAAASAVTGLLERSVSNQMAQDGMVQLREAAALSRKIRELAAYVHVYAIDNIQYPEPGLWRAAILQPSYKRELIQFAGNYVFVKAEGNEIALFWDKVEQYEFITTS